MAGTEIFLHKNTVAEMQSMSATEKSELASGALAGVLLHGYYTYGDTPGSIIYRLNPAAGAEDEGSVFNVDTLKLEHKFVNCDMAYYGLQPAINTEVVADRNTKVINAALQKARKVTITNPGEYWFRGNRGGENGSYYRYVDPNLGTMWGQVGDGDGQPGGILIPSDRIFEMQNAVTLKMRGTFMQAYNLITLWNAENITIRGGKIVGDLDYHHRADGTNDGGEWGYGVFVQGCKNILIENLDISKLWADGIYIGVDVFNNYQRSENITFRNVKLHHNRRQGLSICGGKKLFFENCDFTDTAGTAPQAGVDLELDVPNAKLEDALFLNCNFSRNEIGVRTVDKTDNYINVKFFDCIFEDNRTCHYDSYTANGVYFTRCRFSYHPTYFYALELYGAKNHEFKDCKLYNAVKTASRILSPEKIYRCSDILFDNIIIELKRGFDGLLDFRNAQNITLRNSRIESIILQGAHRIIFTDGGENFNIIGNTFRETGPVLDLYRITGFNFNDNKVINMIFGVGVFKTNVKQFEICNNHISGNCYQSGTGTPAFLLGGPGTAFGKIEGNTLTFKKIFPSIGTNDDYGPGLYREYGNTSDNIVIAGNKTYGFSNTNAFQFNAGSTNLSVSYLNQEATPIYKGLVKQAAFESTILTTDATDLTSAVTLVNDLKGKINSIITGQKAVGQMEM